MWKYRFKAYLKQNQERINKYRQWQFLVRNNPSKYRIVFDHNYSQLIYSPAIQERGRGWYMLDYFMEKPKEFEGENRN